ncbi:benzoate transporter [Pseudarthrobacter chlorophenolicus A6]|uniref:Benzoate transporter n=1 Tax=Pseudarthrobacter chlorophenolicus (strain ATCC 700700 / DSM 12829 / CIP 107037 / JCM 12360 / KCTC 9906 / NCIMB 13794 / A6) TaxID=452863 RepID=B8HH59_PSECP|nr:benzoate/H(+) symporter BenE family transporter [Pseudarthrobacter chlorophenolicus]ACL39648.1 benzoate transporter [Pseudarthrobacter chlorophenolicus A6]SDQ96037.1 benzoate membrane transport protein [Pseudarthrobacter chlorophenolicus]
MAKSSAPTSTGRSASTSTFDSRPVVAGVVTALVGFTSSFAVVLAGLKAVGADPAQAASGLLALTLTVGVGVLLLAWRSKVPVTLAWSTPGAALLATSGTPDGGWPAAVGAFLAAGVLIALTGLIPALGRLMARIPASLAQAMLAGVLLQLCLAPFTALGTVPLFVAPVIACWLLMMKFAPRWAVPAALLVALGVIAFSLAATGTGPGTGGVLPQLVWTTPSFSLQAMVGIALPLFVVTMASQNVPGVAVLRSFGFSTPWRASMLVTGAGTVLGAPFGGHAINLAALSAALAAGEEAGSNRSRRWVAGFTSGLAYLVLAAFSAALVTLVTAAPAGMLEAVAGLALLGTLAASVSSALADAEDRIAPAVTFLMAASGLAFAGIGPAFWALLAGLLVRTLLVPRRERELLDGGPAGAEDGA